MRTVFKSLLSAALVAAFAASAVAGTATAEIGRAAPDFTLTDLNGKAHRLADFKGKTVVLEWVNPECPFVVKHYDSGNMGNLQRKAAADGVVWLTINSAAKGKQGDYDVAAANAWLKKTNAAPAAYMRDHSGAVGRLYGAKVTPHMYVINPEGVLVYNGAIDSIRSTKVDDIAKAENFVMAAVGAAKGGKMPEKTTTQPYGCGVKY
jgi:hypothetical protein